MADGFVQRIEGTLCRIVVRLEMLLISVSRRSKPKFAEDFQFHSPNSFRIRWAIASYVLAELSS
jgi:hypothetical protein